MRLLLVLCLYGSACRPSATVVPVESVSPPPPTSSARRWFLRARMAEARGDLEEAERALKWVVRDDSRRPASHEWLARFYERERRWTDALASWNRSLALDDQRWQPHAALARLSGRAGERALEIEHLERAVALGGDAGTHERLFDLQVRADNPAARGTLDRWLLVSLEDPVQRLRRARAARRLGAHAQAVDDLVIVAEEGARAADVAPLLWESAAQSCRFRTAVRWAERAALSDRSIAATVGELASVVGDPAILERLLDPRAQPPAVGLHRSWPAPELPLGVGWDDPLYIAEAWRRAGRPQRALSLLTPQEGDWVSLVRAYALVGTGEAEAAWSAVSEIERGHPAWLRAQVLGLGLGKVSASDLQALIAPHTEAAIASGAAELYAIPGLIRDKVVVRGLPLGQSEVPDTLVRVSAAASAPLESVMLRTAIDEALAAGQRRDAQRLAKLWTERRPELADAWVGRARSDPEHADGWLERALELAPCHAEALLLRAHHAPAHDALRWLRAAQEAAPYSPTVFEALAQRGLETR